MLKETDHDYQNCLVGNYFSSDMTGIFASWNEFKETHLGFMTSGFDDTYYFVFRYDIHKQNNGKYQLELCMMLQKIGIYTHLFIKDIDQETLDTEVYEWLKGRSSYMKELWKEVMD